PKLSVSPLTVRRNISLPSQSVPKGWLREGAAFLSSKLIPSWSGPINKPLIIRTISRATAATTPVKARFRRFQPPVYPGTFILKKLRSAIGPFTFNSRINDQVQQISNKITNKNAYSTEEGDA